MQPYYGYRMAQMPMQMQQAPMAPFYGSSYQSSGGMSASGGCGGQASAGCGGGCSQGGGCSSGCSGGSSAQQTQVAPSSGYAVAAKTGSQNDCCSGCSSPCKYRSRRKAYSSKTMDPACNSEEFREIIVQYVNDDVSDSKRLIQSAAEEMMGYEVNVICARGEFGYVVHTEHYSQNECYHPFLESTGKPCKSDADCASSKGFCIMSIFKNAHVCCQPKPGTVQPQCPSGYKSTSMPILCNPAANPNSLSESCPTGETCLNSVTQFTKGTSAKIQNALCCKKV